MNNKPFAELREKLAALHSSEPPWFYTHAATEDGLSRIEDGRMDGLFAFETETHVAEYVVAAANFIPDFLAILDDEIADDERRIIEHERDGEHGQAAMARTRIRAIYRIAERLNGLQKEPSDGR